MVFNSLRVLEADLGPQGKVGKVFYMTEAEVSQSGNFGSSFFLLGGRCVKVLFDFRVTHFFVSYM